MTSSDPSAVAGVRARIESEKRWLGRVLGTDSPTSLSMAVAALAVLGLHYAANNDPGRTPLCPECNGKAGTHPCGCWQPEDLQPICPVCREDRGPHHYSLPWPCPSVAAVVAAFQPKENETGE